MFISAVPGRVEERMLFIPELSIMKLCDMKSYVLSFNFLAFYKSLSECVGVFSDSRSDSVVNRIVFLKILPSPYLTFKL